MQIKSHDLAAHLRNSLAPVYLLHGVEPLLIDDSSVKIRNTAQNRGFDERIVLNVDPKFDWSVLLGHLDSLSLFSKKKLIELQLPTGKLNLKGAGIVNDFSNTPAEDTLLLIVCGKLEAGVKNTRWVKQIIKTGIVAEHGLIRASQLPSWIKQRARAYKLNIDHAACNGLAYYLEGNLLAIDQEIKKFAMLDKSQINLEAVLESVEDGARFSVYTYLDVILSGELTRALRILNGLKTQGLEPVIINWAIAKETRRLLEMSYALDRGNSIMSVFKQHRIWSTRSKITQAILKRLPYKTLQAIHQRLCVLDRVIKGRESAIMVADIWTEYEQITVRLCNKG